MNKIDIMESKKQKYVFVNGYGLVEFKSTKISINKNTNYQFKGKIKLPKGVKSNNGKKWIKHNYWYDDNQIFGRNNLPEISLKL